MYFDNFKLFKFLGELIKDYRHWRGLSQETLAERIGVSVRELQRWEANRERARIENRHDLSEVTGIPMQVCVALNADQPIWYSLQKKMFAHSLIEAAQLSMDELFRYRKLPDEGIFAKSERISTEKQLSMILSSHSDIYRTENPLRRDLIKTAIMILPALNRILFDSWGHYVGHNVFLPIKTNVYQQ